MTSLIAGAILFLTASISQCDEPYWWEGVEKFDITVNGVLYQVPYYAQIDKNFVYHLKRAIEQKDSVSREVILGGQQSKTIYIGIESPLWLVITPSTEAVVKDVNL